VLQFLSDAGRYFTSYAQVVFGSAAAVVVLELLLPKSRYSVMSRVRGAVFWVCYIAINALIFTTFYRAMSSLGWKPLVTVDLSFLSSSPYSPLRFTGGCVAAVLLVWSADFLYYWFHRLQHASPLLWRFHREHHSLEEMSAFSSNHHFLEEALRLPFVTLPLLLIVHFEQGYVPWIFATLLAAQSIYEHSCTKISLGPLRYIIPDNRYHRIHHSTDPSHFGKNYGSGSAIWDWLFGTIYCPKPGEWPVVGLEGHPEPKTVKQFLFRPFLTASPAVREDATPIRQLAQ
jgi:sterol desaturase/sphingolipid hydroxylase (fatty acid hydroxylase superfamily)